MIAGYRNEYDSQQTIQYFKDHDDGTETIVFIENQLGIPQADDAWEINVELHDGMLGHVEESARIGGADSREAALRKAKQWMRNNPGGL